MNRIGTIKTAAAQHSVLRVLYQEKDGTVEGWRRVEPYSFSKDDGELGLFAWDIEKNGIRRFTLDRIIEVEITDEKFIPRFEIKILWT